MMTPGFSRAASARVSASTMRPSASVWITWIVVPSTAVGQMRIRYFGRGLIKDNLEPGLLVRIMNKVF